MIKCTRCKKPVKRVDENPWNNMCPECNEKSNQEYRNAEEDYIYNLKMKALYTL